MKRNIFILSFVHAVVVTVYVGGVAWLIFNGERFFGDSDSFFIPFAMLLLFVLSAAVVGTLVLGRPLYLYFDNRKQEGMALLVGTIVCLFLCLVGVYFVSVFIA